MGERREEMGERGWERGERETIVWRLGWF